MGTFHVYLEEGFDHDRVEVVTGAGERVEPDVTTRYQIGLAAVLELAAAGDGPCLLRVVVPGRGLIAESTFDPAAEPHVRVNIRGGSLFVEPAADAPMFA